MFSFPSSSGQEDQQVLPNLVTRCSCASIIASLLPPPFVSHPSLCRSRQQTQEAGEVVLRAKKRDQVRKQLVPAALRLPPCRLSLTLRPPRLSIDVAFQ